MFEKKNYKATTIRPCSNSCSAAKTHADKTLLLDEFDSLILKNCQQPQCVCRFEQHVDRRSGLDRRYLTSSNSQPLVTNNRRLNYGRRVEDIHNRARDNTGEIDLSEAVLHFFSAVENKAG